MTPHILIVDDNLTNMKLAANVLEDAGCKVAKAADAVEAQDLLATLVPDLILMDIAMPGMDGLTLTRKLKADKRYRRIPIVALTASAMKGDDLKALEAGCRGYITKPIDTRRFAEQVFAFLPGAAAQAESPRNANETLHMLIVDDHPANRKVLRAGLEGEGHIVHEAANGQEALNVLERTRVDAVVSDILMPTMDGFRLCLEIRNSNAPYASLPFILYTATYDSPGDRDLAQSVGADGYVIKPAPISVILQALHEAQRMAGRQQRPPAPSIGESDVLEQYNAALVRKVEERNIELLELNQSLERRVGERTAALDAANQELESFSYSVAHDLRAPLRHIGGFADILRETAGAQLNEECQALIVKIMSATERMDRLIHDLLEFSRTSRTELNLTEIELDAVLAAAYEAVQADTQGRNIEWRREKLPKSRGDPALLRQVLVNLLSNAVKYSRTRNPAVIEIGARAADAHEVTIFVHDNGVGFDMEHARKLFGVFQRLHANTEFEGTGIGLATAQRIVARHGGRIWAEAAVDRGATFYISLPAAY